MSETWSNSYKDGVITVFVNAFIYSKECIFKTIYWYGDKFHTNVELVKDAPNTYVITLKPMLDSELSEQDLEMYLAKFEKDLIDFNLRQIVNKETRAIRELITAKAFAHGDLEDDPVGELTDPVGFDVKKLMDGTEKS